MRQVVLFVLMVGTVPVCILWYRLWSTIEDKIGLLWGIIGLFSPFIIFILLGLWNLAGDI